MLLRGRALLALVSLLVPASGSSLVSTVDAIQILANGGFESGMAYWTTIGSIDRSLSTDQFARSGLRSLLTTNLPPYQAFPTGQYLQGAYQHAGGASLKRTLNFSFWIRPQQTSFELHIFAEAGFSLRTLDASPRNVTIRFYVAYQKGKLPANTSDSKHILLSNISPGSPNWDKWNYYQRDLTRDFLSLFPSYTASLVWNIRVSLAVLTLTTVSWAQPVLWDDVGLDTGSPLTPFAVGPSLTTREGFDETGPGQEAANVRPIRDSSGCSD